MLSPTRFEKINGHLPEVHWENGIWFASCQCACGGRPAHLIASHIRSQDFALKRLLDEVLRYHRNIEMERAGWQCRECGATSGLSAHHKVFRSHERDDTVGNLRALCLKCHDHSQLRSAESKGRLSV